MSIKMKLQDPKAEQVLNSSSMDKSADSEHMINEQIQAAIDLLNGIENGETTTPVKVEESPEQSDKVDQKIKKSVVGDQTMMTEKEYIKVLQVDNSTLQDTFNESSFFKGILNVENSGAATDENI